eukprot:3104553-Alexandrium_andersonii.AAC.2
MSDAPKQNVLAYSGANTCARMAHLRANSRHSQSSTAEPVTRGAGTELNAAPCRTAESASSEGLRERTTPSSP